MTGTRVYRSPLRRATNSQYVRAATTKTRCDRRWRPQRSTKLVHVQKDGKNKGTIHGLPAPINEEPVVPACFDPDDIKEDCHNSELLRRRAL